MGLGLSWQQGPLSTGAIGRFLVPEPLPKDCCMLSPCVAGCECMAGYGRLLRRGLTNRR